MEINEKELKQQLIREIAHVVHDKGVYVKAKRFGDVHHTYTIDVPENDIMFYTRLHCTQPSSLTRIELDRDRGTDTLSFYAGGNEFASCNVSEGYCYAISLDRLEKVADLLKTI